MHMCMYTLCQQHNWYVYSLSHRSMTESYLNMTVYITLQYTEALNSEDPSLNGFSTVEIISVCTLVAQKPFVLWIQYR